MTQRYYDVIIVGAGHAGAQAAIALRQNGYDGSLALLSDEDELPYERPPLSKAYLLGQKPFDKLWLRPERFWQDRQIETKLGVRLEDIDPETKQIRLSGGNLLGYEKLIWAAGGTPRQLTIPGTGLAGVHSVRKRSDVDAIRDALESGSRRVVIIGGGYIGLEAAAVCRKLDCTVSLLEAQPRLLSRVAGETVARFFENEHRNRGVQIKTSASVRAIVGEDKVEAVTLDGGEEIPADLVIVGVGINPEIGPLQSVGADCDNGVLIGPDCKTNLTDIYAIGDCANRRNSFAENDRIRMESVANANEMATIAARSICGLDPPKSVVPWFWSDQYELKLQTVGLNHGFDQEVLRGDPSEKSFSVLYLKAGRVVAVDSVNAMKDFVQARKVVEEGLVLPPEQLSDCTKSLKEISESSVSAVGWDTAGKN